MFRDQILCFPPTPTPYPTEKTIFRVDFRSGLYYLLFWTLHVSASFCSWIKLKWIWLFWVLNLILQFSFSLRSLYSLGSQRMSSLFLVRTASWKMWFPGNQHLGACSLCGISVPIVDLVNQNLHLKQHTKAIWFVSTLKFEKTWTFCNA